jgi:glycosyltransferase involved in cell wall biosynthesis
MWAVWSSRKDCARSLPRSACIRDLDWRMVLVGTGDFQPEFERLLTEQGVRDRVFFAGYVPHDETPRWLASMDMLVLPSETQPNWEEQFGRVIPEAMACGAAVVGSDSGEIPHLIRQSEGGLMFHPAQAG